MSSYSGKVVCVCVRERVLSLWASKHQKKTIWFNDKMSIIYYCSGGLQEVTLSARNLVASLLLQEMKTRCKYIMHCLSAVSAELHYVYSVMPCLLLHRTCWRDTAHSVTLCHWYYTVRGVTLCELCSTVWAVWYCQWCYTVGCL